MVWCGVVRCELGKGTTAEAPPPWSRITNIRLAATSPLDAFLKPPLLSPAYFCIERLAMERIADGKNGVMVLLGKKGRQKADHSPSTPNAVSTARWRSSPARRSATRTGLTDDVDHHGDEALEASHQPIDTFRQATTVRRGSQ